LKLSLIKFPALHVQSVTSFSTVLERWSYAGGEYYKSKNIWGSSRGILCAFKYSYVLGDFFLFAFLK